MQFSSILPVDRAPSGATTPGQCGPGSNGSEGVLGIPSITRTSLSNCILISRTLVREALTSTQRCSRCILYPPSRLGKERERERERERGETSEGLC